MSSRLCRLFTLPERGAEARDARPRGGFGQPVRLRPSGRAGPSDDPLRPIRDLADEVLAGQNDRIKRLYSSLGRRRSCRRRCCETTLLQAVASARDRLEVPRHGAALRVCIPPRMMPYIQYLIANAGYDALDLQTKRISSNKFTQFFHKIRGSDIPSLVNPNILKHGSAKIYSIIKPRGRK